MVTWNQKLNEHEHFQIRIGFYDFLGFENWRVKFTKLFLVEKVNIELAWQKPKYWEIKYELKHDRAHSIFGFV